MFFRYEGTVSPAYKDAFVLKQMNGEQIVFSTLLYFDQNNFLGMSFFFIVT